MTKVIDDQYMIDKGYLYKIILPAGKGKPLYTKLFLSACHMVKEYGKGTQVITLKQKED